MRLSVVDITVTRDIHLMYVSAVADRTGLAMPGITASPVTFEQAIDILKAWSKVKQEVFSDA